MSSQRLTSDEIGFVLILILASWGSGGFLLTAGVDMAVDPPDPTVCVEYEVYVHDIPQERPPNSAVAFRALSPQGQQAFLTAHTSEESATTTKPVSQHSNAFEKLTQTEYVLYHGRWFGVTTRQHVITYVPEGVSRAILSIVAISLGGYVS